MKIWISESNSSDAVACLELEKNSQGKVAITCLEGDLPEGLTVHDLSNLAIVTYESGNRGRPIPKVCPIEPSENLDYVRALIEAMPPGYFISKVESEIIDELRKEKAEMFHRELEKIEAEGDIKL